MPLHADVIHVVHENSQAGLRTLVDVALNICTGTVSPSSCAELVADATEPTTALSASLIFGHCDICS